MRKKPSTRWDLNPWHLCYEACALPLYYNCCLTFRDGKKFWRWFVAICKKRTNKKQPGKIETSLDIQLWCFLILIACYKLPLFLFCAWFVPIKFVSPQSAMLRIHFIGESEHQEKEKKKFQHVTGSEPTTSWLPGVCSTTVHLLNNFHPKILALTVVSNMLSASYN